MGDAGEGLIDAESRIQERMEELARARAERDQPEGAPRKVVHELESLKLARADVQRQFDATTHEHRRQSLAQALADLDRRIAALEPAL